MDSKTAASQRWFKAFVVESWSMAAWQLASLQPNVDFSNQPILLQPARSTITWTLDNYGKSDCYFQSCTEKSGWWQLGLPPTFLALARSPPGRCLAVHILAEPCQVKPTWSLKVIKVFLAKLGIGKSSFSIVTSSKVTAGWALFSFSWISPLQSWVLASRCS